MTSRIRAVVFDLRGIDALARAHWEWRVATRAQKSFPRDRNVSGWVARVRRHVVVTQRDYRLLAGGRIGIGGPKALPDSRGWFVTWPVRR